VRAGDWMVGGVIVALVSEAEEVEEGAEEEGWGWRNWNCIGWRVP
jgi:hypothetical protein